MNKKLQEILLVRLFALVQDRKVKGIAMKMSGLLDRLTIANLAVKA